jgi:hypothetical protein
MIYEFFSDKTSGILTNYLSSLADMPSLMMLEYSVLEYHTKPEHKEFLEKFYKLAEEYKCRITYHPLVGMVVTSNNK